MERVMLPEVAESFTESYTGAQLPDHYGALTKRAARPIPSHLRSQLRRHDEHRSFSRPAADNTSAKSSNQRTLGTGAQPLGAIDVTA